MAFYRPYRCPDCGGIFRFLHHPNDSPPPDECELCHSPMTVDEPVFLAQAPRIGTQLGKGQDQVYRQMETASEARMELMAEHGGGSASDYRHTRITDMGDSSYVGDTAAKYSPPSNYVQEFMKLNQGQAVGGFAPSVAGAQPVEYAAAAHTGSYPHAGAGALDRIRGNHASLARAIESGGRINKK